MVLGGYRYSPPPAHPAIPPPRVHLPPATRTRVMLPLRQAEAKVAVGLISVAQLTLVGHFSGFRGITEAYNLEIAGNPNDHYFITGND